MDETSSQDGDEGCCKASTEQWILDDALLVDFEERLIKGDRREKIEICSLLAALNVERLACDSKLISRVLDCMTDNGDMAVAAEAAATVREWIMNGKHALRLLYAHCLFPRVLKWFGPLTDILGRGGCLNGEEEGRLLQTILEIAWVIIEEIPVAITQLYQSQVWSLAVGVLERGRSLGEQTILALLQLLLTAIEDNNDKLIGPREMNVHLISLLENLSNQDQVGACKEALPLQDHPALLAYSLAIQMREREPAGAHINRLVQTLALKGPLTFANMAMMQDLFEILANLIVDVNEGFPEGDHLIEILLMAISSPPQEEESNAVAECLQRALGCLTNMILLRMETISKGTRSSLWKWLLFNVLGKSETDLYLSPTLLPSLAQLMRHMAVLVAPHQNNSDLQFYYDQEGEQKIRHLCQEHFHEDSIVSPLLLVAAALFDRSFCDPTWIVDLIMIGREGGEGGLFCPSRPMQTILGVAEVLEELHKHHLIPPALHAHLQANRMAVMQMCLSACNQSVSDTEHEQLEYINTILDAIL